MQVGIAASNFGFNQYQPFPAMYNYQMPGAPPFYNHPLNQPMPQPHAFVPNNNNNNNQPPSQVVDRRFIQDKSYVKKKF